MQLLLLVSSIVACFGENVDVQLDFTDSKVHDIKGQVDLDAFIGKSQITAIYFYKRVIINFDDFIRDYKQAAEELESHEVSFGFCDCAAELNKDMKACDISEAEDGIHTYKSGKEKILFQLKHLHSIHSIVGNILQLVMLHDVPILRNEVEVGTYFANQGRKKDLVLAYFPVLGTYEHRIFLEAAFANKDKFQFVVSKDRQSTRYFGDDNRIIKNVPSLWWMWASDNFSTFVKYAGNFTLEEFTKFLNTISKPKLFDIPDNGMDHPFSSFEVPVVKFYYNSASKEQVYEEADVVIRYFGGAIGIVAINMDREETKSKYQVEEELPTLSFQRSAEASEEFIPASFDTPSILNYISITLNEKPTSEMVEEGMAEKSDQIEDPPHNIEEVSKQDDTVADAVYMTRKVELPLLLVPALTDKTFPKFVKDSDTAVVMFYFHFDALSHGNIRMFGEAAYRLGEQTTLKLARVSCFDWTDVCQKEKLTIFPTLRIYMKGKMAWDYTGPQDTQAFYSTLKLLELSPPVYETDKDKLMKYTDGKEKTYISEVTNTTVVGLFREGDKKDRNVFKEFAKSYRERILFVYTDIQEAGDIAKKYEASVPTVILFKYDDSIQPFVTFDGKFTLQNLQEFVDSNKLPKLTVLTPLMFPEVRKRFSELLILFTDGRDKSQKYEDTVRMIVKAEKFSNISVNMMHVPDESSVGFRVLQNYMPSPEIPHLSFVRFQKGEVFNFETSNADMVSLSNWVSNIQKGTVEPSTSLLEKEWKPRNKGYEFLKIMEWEKRNPAQLSFTPEGTPDDAVEDKETDENDEGNDDKSSDHDEADYSRGHHHVFHGRSSHLPVHSHRTKKGDHSEREIHEKEGIVEHENQEKPSVITHEHTEL